MAGLALLCVGLGLPFISRAYFVDDHYHTLMARGLLEHPGRPYDFRADDAGEDNVAWEKGEPPRMVNPPAHHYALALFWKAGGGRLWVLRLGHLLLAAGAAMFLFLLARHFFVPPGPATALVILTPAFWLTSYSLLIDSTMLMFFLAALWTWIEGLKRNAWPWLVASGFLMGLTVLTKYTGAFIVPLALLWWLLMEKGRRPVKGLVCLALPGLWVAGWSLWNIATYGEPHILAAARRAGAPATWAQVFVFATFFSGSGVLPLAAWAWSWQKDRRVFWTGGILLAILAAALGSPWGGFTPSQAVLGAFLAAGTAVFILEWIRRWRFFSGLRSDLFLVAWLVAGSCQILWVMGWVAARYFLIVLPPLAFLTFRFARQWHGNAPERLRRFQAAMGAVLLVAGASLAAADYAQAEARRRVARDTRRDGWVASGRRCFFLGDSFTESYLKYEGWRPAFPGTEFQPGDLVLRQRVTMPAWWFRADRERVRWVKAYEYRSRWPLRVMDNGGGAGFYASAWGALPFTFSQGPLERYDLLEITAPIPAEKA